MEVFESKQYSSKVLSYYKSDGFFWVRIFRKGFSIKNINKIPFIFSERNGFAKGIKIGKYYLKILN